MAAGAAVAALAWFAPPGANDAGAPAKNQPITSLTAPPSGETSRLALPQRAPIGEQRGEIFGSKSWTPVPAAVTSTAASAPPLVPVAPPNPYKVAGTLTQDGPKRVYLVKGDRVYEAKLGDELDDGYRVDSIGADNVVLLYVPLGKKEELLITSTLGVDVAQTPPSAPLPAAVFSPSAPLAAAPSPVSGAATKPAQLRWEGPERVHAGANFTVALRLSSEEPLSATPMMLRYEPKLLEAVAVRAGKFFGDGSFSYRMNPDGSIFVGATGKGMAPGADAELVVVTFKSIKSGATAEVSLSSLALQGAAGRALPHDRVSTFRTSIQ